MCALAPSTGGSANCSWGDNWPHTVIDHCLLCYDIYNNIIVFDLFNLTFNKERNIKDFMSQLCYAAKYAESGQRGEKQPNSFQGIF